MVIYILIALPGVLLRSGMRQLQLVCLSKSNCDSICRGAVSNSWGASASMLSSLDVGRPSKQTQHTASRSLTEPDDCRRTKVRPSFPVP